MDGFSSARVIQKKLSHTPKMLLRNVLFLSMRTKQQNGVLHGACCSDVLKILIGIIQVVVKLLYCGPARCKKRADLCANQGERLRVCQVRSSD